MQIMYAQILVKLWSSESFCSSGNNHKRLGRILIDCYVKSLQCILLHMDIEVMLC